jgi:hypothetical protein
MIDDDELISLFGKTRADYTEEQMARIEKNIDLIRKYHTKPTDLSPEVRAHIARSDALLAEKRARGEIAPPTRPGDNVPIGLNDKFEPYPITPRPGNKNQ